MNRSFNCPDCKNPIELDAMSTLSNLRCPTCGVRISVQSSEVPKGTEISGYRIERKLTSGGMGEIYLATQLTLDRIVAFKILPPEITNDSDAIESFLQEVRSLGKLVHPNIVTAFDSGKDVGIYYLAMAYVEGVSIDDRLLKGESFEVREAVDLMIQVANALSYAWDKYHLLHRDIKPANIMIDEANMVKLLDFGLARSIHVDKSKNQDNHLEGTPNYISPEQALGTPDIDFRSDIYSLGATLHHMLTGELPYKGITEEELFTKDRLPPLPPVNSFNPKISSDCSEVVRRMTHPNPARRYDSWKDLIKALQQVKKSAGKQAEGKKKAVATAKPAGPSIAKKPQVKKKVMLKSAPSAAGTGGGASPSAQPRPQMPTPQAAAHAAGPRRKSAAPGIFAGLLAMGILGGAAYYFLNQGSGPADPPPDDAEAVAAQAARNQKMEFYRGKVAQIKSAYLRDKRSLEMAITRLTSLKEQAEGLGLEGEIDTEIQNLQARIAALEVEPDVPDTPTVSTLDSEALVEEIISGLRTDVAASILKQDFSSLQLALYQAHKELEPLGVVTKITALDKAAREVAQMPQIVLESIKADSGKEVQMYLKTGIEAIRIKSVVKNQIRVSRLLKKDGQVVGSTDWQFQYEDLSAKEKARRLGTEDDPARDVMRGILAYEMSGASMATKFFELSGHDMGKLLIEQLRQSGQL